MLKVKLSIIRNNLLLAAHGKYPAGTSYFPHETTVAIPSWDGVSPVELRAVIAHELHHMARWQNAGYGDTLGGAIASEGIASYYEELRSGRKPPWAQVNVEPSVVGKAYDEWSNKDYNHVDWFFGGKYDEWAGYSIGYAMAKKCYKDFDLEKSLLVTPEEFFNQAQA